MRDIFKCRVCGRYVEDRIHCGRETILFLEASKRVSLSKLISGLLRHFPWEAGLRLDPHGWVSIDDLVRGIREKWRNRELYQWVRPEHVVAVALLDPKERFELRNNMIRARYGHSIDVSIDYPRAVVKNLLYHGTSRDRVLKILVEGIKPMKRKYVHLTIDHDTAVETGGRHGEPVVLKIDPFCLEDRGYTIFRATSKIYLVKYVPPECIIK